MNAKRLLELADYLDKVGTSKPFDFSITVNECGSAGCALWDLHSLHPRAFPVALFKDDYGDFTGKIEVPLDERVCEWFGISGDDCDHLFAPGWSDLKLSADATRKQVAKHIRKFVKARAKEATQ